MGAIPWERSQIQWGVNKGFCDSIVGTSCRPHERCQDYIKTHKEMFPEKYPLTEPGSVLRNQNRDRSPHSLCSCANILRPSRRKGLMLKLTRHFVPAVLLALVLTVAVMTSTAYAAVW